MYSNWTELITMDFRSVIRQNLQDGSSVVVHKSQDNNRAVPPSYYPGYCLVLFGVENTECLKKQRKKLAYFLCSDRIHEKIPRYYQWHSSAPPTQQSTSALSDRSSLSASTNSMTAMWGMNGQTGSQSEQGWGCCNSLEIDHFVE